MAGMRDVRDVSARGSCLRSRLLLEGGEWRRVEKLCLSLVSGGSIVECARPRATVAPMCIRRDLAFVVAVRMRETVRDACKCDLKALRSDRFGDWMGMATLERIQVRMATGGQAVHRDRVTRWVVGYATVHRLHRSRGTGGNRNEKSGRGRLNKSQVNHPTGATQLAEALWQ